MIRFTFPILFLLILMFASCQKEKKYTIATLTEGTTYYNNGKAISSIVKEIDIDLEVLTDTSYGSFENCRLLWDDKVDFAIAQNDTRVVDFLDKGMSMSDSKIRTVLPIYPELLYIIYPDSIKAETLRDLVLGRRIGVGPLNSGTSKFFAQMLKHYGIDSNEYTFVYTPWPENVVSNKIDISVMLAGFNTAPVIKMLNEDHCTLFSFGDLELYQKGSPVEGFCMNYQTARPFIIPQNTFGSTPKEPILTFAVDAVLLCNKSIDKYTIYAMVNEIYSQKNILTELDPLLGSLSDNFDRTSLNFPLHKGSEMFLDRNEPGFFERYAELMGVVLSVLIALFGAFAGIIRIRKARLKNRIDVYYQKLMDIEMNFNKGELSSKEAIQEISILKKEAVLKLIDEKLTANESFNIFLKLCEELELKLNCETPVRQTL